MHPSGLEAAICLPGVIRVEVGAFEPDHDDDGEFIGQLDDDGRFVPQRRGWVLLGAHVGWTDGARPIADWKGRAILVDKSRAKVPPETRIDAARFPLVHRAALASPLVAVATRFGRDGDDGRLQRARETHVASGARVYDLMWDRVGGGGYLGAVGGGEPTREFGGELILQAADGGSLDDLDYDNARPIERILKLISGGAIDGEMVDLAVRLAVTVDEAHLKAWESFLARVFADAAHEKEARALAATIATAAPGTVAHRVRLPALLVGETKLALPATECFVVKLADAPAAR